MRLLAKIPCAVILLMIVVIAGSAPAVSGPHGDIDGDYDIDGRDLQILAERWLDPDCLPGGCDEDFDGKDGVNAVDFAVLAERWGVRGANVVINEFMAVNKYSNYTTVEGQPAYSDWVEIHNPGPGDVNVSGWFLTDKEDELAKWPLPAIVLGADEYLLVFCSDISSDDHPTNYPYFDGVYYHTNFQLDGDGEYLALVDRHLYVIHEYRSCEYGFERFGYPPQQQDMSYGLYGSQEQYFPSPTPGNDNASGYEEMSGEVLFSRDSGTFTDSFQLTLSTAASGAVIRYTTDGSVPTSSSAQYTAPLTINNVTEVIARVFEPGKAPGPVAGRTYVALASDAASFNSNIPIVVVDTHGGGIDQYSYRRCSAVFIERPVVGGRANITDSADFAGRCGIRIRGSSTAGIPKHQYSFETWDERDRDESFSVLGLPADSDWVLYGPSEFDRALINNPLAYELSRQVGRYAVRTRACELYLNTGGGKVTQSDYVGLYFFMEKIRISDDRLDIGSLEPWDSTEPKITGGYVLAIDRDDPDPGDDGFYTSRGFGLFNYIDTPETQLTATQKTWIRDWLDEFENVLYGADSTDPLNGYAKYIDVGSHIDHSLLNVLPLNVDAFRLSGYMAKYRGGKLHAGPIWDFDRAFESTDSRDDYPEAWDQYGGASFFGYVWYARFHEDIDFWQRYIDRWYELRLNQFSTENIDSIIDGMADEIREAADRNYARWSSYGPRFGGFQGEIDHMKDWLETRANWIDRQFVRPPVMTPNGGYVEAGSTVTLSNPNGTGTIYYTLDGSDPREFRSSSGEVVTLVPEDAPKRVLVPTGPVGDWKGDNEPFDDTLWTHGNYVADKTGGVGYDENSDYKPYISHDVESLMNGDLNPSANTTCYVRIPFNVTAEDLAKLQSLTLKIRCDDGFIAYLNGRTPDVARTTNAPSDPAWNSSSNGSGPEDAAFKTFNISSYISFLNAGDNILAVHGLNAGNTSSDFLVSAALEAGLEREGDSNSPGAVSPRAIRYTGTPITLDISTRITARVLVGSNAYSPWSGLAKIGFGVTPVAESLRITEIMYHPQDTNDTEDPNEEYIELQNIGTETINLNQVRFTNGIDFTFGDIDLDPGQYAVVAAKQSAFEAKYPSFPGVFGGEYTGKLDNGGERIELVDAIGRTIHNFSYSDGWRSITDGDGFSLTIIDTSEIPPVVSENGLVAHWKLDESSGTTAEDSAGTNDGTLYGDPTWTAGRVDGALRLDGTGDYILASAAGPLTWGPARRVTVSVWVKVTGLTEGWNPILTQHDAANDGYYFYIYEDEPAFTIMMGGADALASSPETIGWNEWHHLAGTNDGSTIRLYVDGSAKASASSTGLTGADYSLYIGCDYTSSAYFSGYIDDLRIYDRVLSDYEFGVSSDSQDRWGEKDSWRASVYVDGSPGWDDSGILPNPGAIVINEVLAHSHGVAADWIELYNTTNAQIDIGGWYLSDVSDDLKKYVIAAGTKINAYGYLVFHEDANFGESSGDPGSIAGFALSEDGDEVYLSSGEGGVITGYRATEDFGASQTGVSFGRYFKRSTGNYNFVSMDHITLGTANAYPKVGPIVISEIMYNPQSDDQNREFIELHNISSSAVTLYDSNEELPWKFTDGVDYTFPDYPGLTLSAGGYVVLTKDITAYISEYGMPPFGVMILGSYAGQLNNSGEKVELAMPGDLDEAGIRHYIRIDSINYSDGSHPEDYPGDVDLWPMGADGEGSSLDRIDSTLYGNDPNNWRQRPPTPGAEDSGSR